MGISYIIKNIMHLIAYFIDMNSPITKVFYYLFIHLTASLKIHLIYKQALCFLMLNYFNGKNSYIKLLCN